MPKTNREKLPDWFRVHLPGGTVTAAMHRRLGKFSLNTVCESARCPNQGECWGAGTATVMILGDVCSRACRFCAVASGHPGGVADLDEPARVAGAVVDAGLLYVVLTSVDRDDLDDGGAAIFAQTIRAIRDRGVMVEALIPDYLGDRLSTVINSGPDVLAHNVEVVRRLSPEVRDRRASYDRSLEVIRQAKGRVAVTKSSLMVGMGETLDEITQTLRDLRSVDCDVVTVGQYLQPTARHYPVTRYLHPEEFNDIGILAKQMGFAFVASGPLVRSSYKAEEAWASATGGRESPLGPGAENSESLK